jgi:hypothetical protein
VRVLDVNGDGYVDAVIANEKTRQTRIWSPESQTWTTTDFPAEIVSVDEQGRRCDCGVRFGVLERDGRASVVVRNERTSGVWHFDGRRWVQDPHGLEGLEAGGAVFTSTGGRDRGVRLVDLDGDGVCELVVGNPDERAVFRRISGRGGWSRLPFALPPETSIVDAQGRDAGLRLVDINEDGHPDVVFSNPDRYSLHLFVSISEGWSRKVLAGKRGDPGAIPMIVRPDGTNNGAWFHYRHMYVQNEQTGTKVLKDSHIQSRSFASLLGADKPVAVKAGGTDEK